jgi:hypothetical protein
MSKLIGTSLALAFSLLLAGCAHDPDPRSPVDVDDGRAPIAGIERGDVAGVRAKLAEHRKLELARLEAYASAGVFPRNMTSAAPLHMLRDPDGRRCAVAHLAHLDGYDRALDAMAEEHNDLEFAEVKDGALYDFVLTSGLTQEEIARIQMPAPPMSREDAPQPVAEAPRLPNEAEIRAQLQAHFREVAREIVASTDKSLDVAVARLAARSSAHPGA